MPELVASFFANSEVRPVLITTVKDGSTLNDLVGKDRTIDADGASK